MLLLLLLLLLVTVVAAVLAVTVRAVAGDGYGHRAAPARLQDERIVR
ncbi:hypothetical protein [Aeromicrobium massiliense]|nr:hypothetical protein [Aeromicrobium massiliense]